jgi:hypothetical protein
MASPAQYRRAATLTGADLRRLRQHARMRRADLAALLQCHPGSLRNLETNPACHMSPPFALAVMLALAPDGPAQLEAALAHAAAVLARPRPAGR